MSFGLHGAAATFQRLIDWVLAPHQHYAAAYMDDIIVYADDWGQHLNTLWAVLQELRLTSLTVNPRKCALGKAETKYLGFMVGQGCIRSLTDKIEAIQDYSPPQTKKQMQAFLGWVSYYRRFIPHFTAVTAPLTTLKGMR